MLPLETTSFEKILELDKVLEGKDFIDIANYLKKSLDIDHVVYHSPNMPNYTMVNPFLEITYSKDWNQNYREKGYVYLDPIVKRGMMALLPFDWSTTYTDDRNVLRFLGDAQDHKVGNHGLSIPIRGDNYKFSALFSISKITTETLWHKLRKDIVKDIVIFAHYIHAKQIEKYNDINIRPQYNLSKREIEVASWASEGKSHEDIASILNLSINTIHSHLETIRYKTNSLNTTQAIVKLFKVNVLH